MSALSIEAEGFHIVNNNDNAVLPLDLVKGYGEIDVYVEHMVDEPILLKGKSDLGFENVEEDRIERKNREARRICKYID